MIIYNSKEMETGYMYKDELVVEIHSALTPEEMLEKIRNGEEITPDIATIAAFSVGDGSVVTQAEAAPQENTSHYDYNTVLDAETREDLEENVNHDRHNMFKAFEAFQFNRPWRHFEFQPCDISKEQLATQLYAALNIMPTIKDIPDKDIAELKRMSTAGDRLYWNFLEVNHNNKLPSRADIEFYENLTDYEKRIINESGVHPAKMLDIARGIKEKDPGRLLTTRTEHLAHEYNSIEVINIEKKPESYFVYLPHDSLSREMLFNNPRDLALYIRSRFDIFKNAEITAIFELIKLTKENISQNLSNIIADDSKLSLSDIRLCYNQKLEESNADKKESVLKEKKEAEFNYFAKCMLEARVFPEESLQKIAKAINDGRTFIDISAMLIKDYRKIYEEEFLPGKDETGFAEEDVRTFAESKYQAPVPECIQTAEKIFKELYHGHAPRVLSEYMFAQFLAKDIKPRNVTENDIKSIAESFDQKNVSKVAKYKNLTLFALADKLNFNEIKVEHLEAFAIFINPDYIKAFFDKGFIEWYKEHKDTNISNLVELLSVHEQIEYFDKDRDAKELVADINNAKGKADCRLMEQKYHYKFSDNELAIRGRHVVAQQGKIKMYMLSKNDYRNFTVGYDTSCCQHYGNAGESCVWKLTTDPFAGVVVIERDGKILAQGFVWTDEAQDTLVFDNVEFADDRKVGQFNSLFAAWSRAMPYKNIHVGTGYNQGMHSWGKKITFSAALPTTLDDRRIYSDYHNDARSLKFNGVMQIGEKEPVKITTKADEPTRWDILARPETAFLLNDCHSSIESRMNFANNFLNEQTPEIQLEAVKRNVFAIKYIEHPTEEVQKYVIQRDPKYATLIKDPCVEVQKILINLDPAYIRHIKHPDEEMVLKAVQQNGLLLGDIENPSPVAIRIAVEQNGYAIRFVENQTEELQVAAVRNSPKVVSLLRSPSNTVLQTAINADPSVISLLQRPSEELQLFAVEKDPYVINSIDMPAYAAVRKAVEKNGLLIRKFQFEYPHLREVALKQNAYAIRTLKNITDEEYVLAVKQNRNIATLIRDPELQANVLNAVDSLNEENEMER